MKLKFFLITIISLYLIIIFSNHIANFIISTNKVKNIITENINKYIKRIDLSNIQINPGYMTSIYDLYLFIYDLKDDDYSISVYGLYRIELNLKKFKGYLKFKFYTGPSYKMSLGDEVTIDLDNIYLNYTIGVIFHPFKIIGGDFSFSILYNVESEKFLINYLMKKGFEYFKSKIEQAITDYLEKIPNLVHMSLKDLIKKYDSTLKIIHLYIGIYYASVFIFLYIIYFAEIIFKKAI